MDETNTSAVATAEGGPVAARGSRTQRPAPHQPWIIRFVGTILGLVTLTLVVLGTVALSSYYTVVQYIRGRAVEVPNLTGRDVSLALEELGPLGLTLAFDRSEYSDTLAEGTILRQRPQPGRQAKRGTTVYVVVSRGPQLTATPDVSGYTQREARSLLAANDLRVSEQVSLMHSSTVPADVVIAQTPPPGLGLRRGQEVHLLVSLGPERVTYAAPDLRGLTIPEVNAVLEPLGCTVGTVAEREAPPGAVRGTVLEQTPPPGGDLERGGQVNLVVARQY